MAKQRNLLILVPLAAIAMAISSLLGEASHADSKDAGEKGAEVYCFMRASGNDHEVSWSAAYEVIKRQKSSLFKTSPKHAAVMITEAVVVSPESNNNCGRYLGDIFDGSTTIVEGDEDTGLQEEEATTTKKGDRYSY